MSRSRFPAAIVAGLLALTVLAACGGSDAEITQQPDSSETSVAGASTTDQNNTAQTTAEEPPGNVAVSADIPENWPAIIGVPTTLVPGSARFNVVDIPDVATAISGSFEYAAGDPYGEEIVARLKADGWSGDAGQTSDGGVNGVLRKDGASVQIVADPNFANVTYTEPVG